MAKQLRDQTSTNQDNTSGVVVTEATRVVPSDPATLEHPTRTGTRTTPATQDIRLREADIQVKVQDIQVKVQDNTQDRDPVTRDSNQVIQVSDTPTKAVDILTKVLSIQGIHRMDTTSRTTLTKTRTMSDTRRLGLVPVPAIWRIRLPER